MITIIVNDVVEISHRNTFLEEQQQFQHLCAVLKGVADRINGNGDPTSSARFFRTPDTATLRTVAGTGWDYKDTKIIATLTPDSGIVSKTWKWFDREVENSQGGTTRFTGWELV